MPLVPASSVPPAGRDSHRRLTPDVPSSSSSPTNDVVISNDNTQVEPGIESTAPHYNAQVSPQPSSQTGQPDPTPTQPTSTVNTDPTPTTNTQPQQPTNPSPANIHPMGTRGKNQIRKPNLKHSLLTIKTQKVPPIPTTVTQAMRDENWRNAMGEEIDAQIRNRTYELVPPRPYQNIISTKWVYSYKYFPDGTLRRHKARWVARGCKQQQGLDYSETFSPVVKSLTIRLVLQLDVSRAWQIKQLDVNNAFLQGTLSDEVYVSQPPGFVDKDRPHHVCRLRKALYGLKQAPRAWYQELQTFLCSLGFRNSLADTSVFVYNNAGRVVYCLVYVDDIIVTGSSDALVADFIAALSHRFSLKEPTDLEYFLGIEVTRTPHGMHLM